jgi:hypothetical protein
MATLRCTEAFAHFVKGYPDVARPGDLFDAGDPVVKVGGANRFEPVEVTVARASGVEQATAAPGEKRSVSKSAVKKTAEKS